MANNNRKIALTEQEVQELMDGESVFLNVDNLTIEIYKGDEEDNQHEQD